MRTTGFFGVALTAIGCQLAWAGLEIVASPNTSGGTTMVVSPSDPASAARQRARSYTESSGTPVAQDQNEGGAYIGSLRSYRNDADYSSDRARELSTGRSGKPAIPTITLPDGTIIVDEAALERSRSGAAQSRSKARSYIQDGNTTCGSGNETGAIGGSGNSKDIRSSSSGSVSVNSSGNCR
ncbi:MAG: hypothetical protein RIR00_234 [Pseudomonadota bacterium]|jgi:hypothetical protein